MGRRAGESPSSHVPGLRTLVAFRRDGRVSERQRGSLDITHKCWGATCRKLHLLHPCYCSFATGEQQQTGVSSLPRQMGKAFRRLQNEILDQVFSNGSLRGEFHWFKLSHTRPNSLLIDSAFPKMSAGISSQERQKGFMEGLPSMWRGPKQEWARGRKNPRSRKTFNSWSPLSLLEDKDLTDLCVLWSDAWNKTIPGTNCTSGVTNVEDAINKTRKVTNCNRTNGLTSPTDKWLKKVKRRFLG